MRDIKVMLETRAADFSRLLIDKYHITEIDHQLTHHAVFQRCCDRYMGVHLIFLICYTQPK